MDCPLFFNTRIYLSSFNVSPYIIDYAMVLIDDARIWLYDHPVLYTFIEVFYNVSPLIFCKCNRYCIYIYIYIYLIFLYIFYIIFYFLYRMFIYIYFLS